MTTNSFQNSYSSFDEKVTVPIEQNPHFVPYEGHIPYDFVFYHRNCPDGNGAAWVYYYYLTLNNPSTIRNQDETFIYGNTRFIGVDPGKVPQNMSTGYLTGKRILFVDNCFKRPDIEHIAKIAHSIKILDHHISNKEALADINIPNVIVVFDMDRCGTEITWDEFFPYKEPSSFKRFSKYFTGRKQYISFEGSNRPWFIDVIADRDVWRWRYENETRPLGLYLYKTGVYREIQNLTRLLNTSSSELKEMKITGETLQVIEKIQILDVAKRAILRTYISRITKKPYTVYIVGCGKDLASDVGHLLSDKPECDFAVMYLYNLETDEWYLSLRGSKHKRISVEEIAKEWEGGGHTLASGMTLNNQTHQLKDVFQEIE